MAHHSPVAPLRSHLWRVTIALLVLVLAGCGSSRDRAGGDTSAASRSALRVLFLGETPANVDGLDLFVTDADAAPVLQDAIPLDPGQLTVSLPDASIARFEVQAYENATESITYLGCAAARIEGTSTVTVRMFPVDGPNQLPVVVIPPGTQASFEGEALSPFYLLANDPDCDPLTYSAVGLPGGVSIDSLTGRFSGIVDPGAAEGSPYEVTVTVAEEGDSIASVNTTFTWTVTPAAVNTPPVANAGVDQTVRVGDTVILDGSASSDANEDPLTYSWTLTPPVESAATLSDPTAAQPTFLADLAGDYVAELVVNDGSADSVAGAVTVTAVENTAPVAYAGPDQTVAQGDTVTLDGSTSSDADGDPLSYSWTLTPPVESAAILSDPTAAQPTFLADLSGTYEAELVVNDGSVDSLPDTVTITAEVVPSILGLFSLSGTETLSGCLDPADDGLYEIAATADFTTQTGGSFSGTSSVLTPFPSSGPIDGTIAADGSVSGNVSYQREADGTVSQGTFTGTLRVDTLSLTFSGQDVSGDTCSFSGTLTGTRAF